MKIDRLYYTVEQLAEHWLMSIDDILQLGLTNQLAFLTQADWEYPRTKLMLRGEHTGITAQELSNIYFAKEPFSEPGNAGETANGILKGEECIITYHPGLDRLIIDASEVKRFEREHPELAATDNIPKPNEKNTVFFSGRGVWRFFHRRSGLRFIIGRTKTNKYLLLPCFKRKDDREDDDEALEYISASQDFQTTGFFYLDKIDRFTYEQTQNASLVKRLTPCTGYNEVESTIADIRDSVQIGGLPISHDDCYFLIDRSQPFILDFNFKFNSLNQTGAGENIAPTEPSAGKEPALTKELGDKDKARADSLRNFIAEIEVKAKKDNLDFNCMELDYTRAELFKKLQNWEKGRGKTKINGKELYLWFDKAGWGKFWNRQERKAICDIKDNKRGRKKQEPKII